MQSFYRLEHKTTRCGPYTQYSKNGDLRVAELLQKCAKINLYSSQHPTPWGDGLIRADICSFFFGFKTLKKLKEWFVLNDSIVYWLRQEDFVIARYLVEERFDGNKQSISKLKGAKRYIIPFP